LKEQAKMRKYFSVYKDYIQKRINVATKQELETLLIEHLEKIEFIKHERLIHLLVTMLFVFMFFMSLILWAVTDILAFLILLALILVLLVPYIIHYYFLENTTQEMYVIYDKIIGRME
jgi:hypothetical protein